MDTTIIQTPAGPLAILATDAGTVTAAGFTADPTTLLTGLQGSSDAPVRSCRDLGQISKAVQAYLTGDLDRLAEIPVAQAGNGMATFQAAVWRALRDLRGGEVVSYSQLAARVGRPTAVRAAAGACARNTAALFVPCHRVRRTDGCLGGYRWGTEVKEWLLAHEQAAGAR